MTEHAPFTHDHPQLVIALLTRTRLFGTMNVAVALRGQSCGWGSCDRPRKTFVGRIPRRRPDTGKHFIELAVMRNGMRDERIVFRIGDSAVSHCAFPSTTEHTGCPNAGCTCNCHRKDT